MIYANTTHLMGNLTRKPELVANRNGTASQICNFGLAMNRKYRDSAGNEQSEVCFVDCVAFGRQAEVVHQYCDKGSPLYIEGYLRLDRWQDQNGQNRQKLKVVAQRISLLGAGDGSYQRQQQQDAAPQDIAAG